MPFHRRHLTAGQKAAIAAEALPHFEEEAKKRQIRKPADSVVENIPPQNEGKSRDHAAAQVGVNPHYVSDAKKIKDRSQTAFLAIGGQGLARKGVQRVREWGAGDRELRVARLRHSPLVQRVREWGAGDSGHPFRHYVATRKNPGNRRQLQGGR